MKPFSMTAAASISLLTFVVGIPATAQTPFDKRLSNEQRIIHALNRLTFGVRAGDVEAVQRLGVEKWIAQQMHPETIQENATLENRLKPLDTLRLDSAAILKEYPAVPPNLPRPRPLSELVAADQVRRLLNGTLEERQSVLRALDNDKRRMVLAAAPPQSFAPFPELQKEAEAARQADQAERQKEFRKLMPPLNDLLNPEQMSMAIRGNKEQLAELFAYLDPAKRQQVAAALPPQALVNFPEMRRLGAKLRQPQQVALSDLREGKLYRAVYSNRQLQEVLVDFWLNHFNVFEGKQSVRPLLTSYERDAIRPHVLGHFKDLLLATARHPAMLYYLDNWESMSPDVFSIGPFAEPVEAMARGLARRARGLNENYGRELMELHTLGVNGGYTQKDVVEVARCFTGWTIRDPNTNPQFVFAAFMHDNGEKTVLGHKIAAGGGEQDGMQVIDILLHHPSTAKFISRKLAQHFVADDPPKALVERLAQVFTKTDGDLRTVLTALFASPEFFSEGAWQSKIKSPLEFVASALRATGADATDSFTLTQKIADLGEPLYGKQEPTGYPETGEAWLSTAALFGRINFAAGMASGQIPGVRIDSSRLEGKDAGVIARDLLGRDPSPQTREVLEKELAVKAATPRFIAGILIGSPDFQKR